MVNECLSALIVTPNPFYIWAFPSDLHPEGSGVWCIPPWGLRGPGSRAGALLRGPRDPLRGLRWRGPPRRAWAFPSPEEAAEDAASEPDAWGRAYRRWAECVVLEVELLSFGGLDCVDGRVVAPFLRVVAPRAYAAALAEERLLGA